MSTCIPPQPTEELQPQTQVQIPAAADTAAGTSHTSPAQKRRQQRRHARAERWTSALPVVAILLAYLFGLGGGFGVMLADWAYTQSLVANHIALLSLCSDISSAGGNVTSEVCEDLLLHADLLLPEIVRQLYLTLPEAYASAKSESDSDSGALVAFKPVLKAPAIMALWWTAAWVYICTALVAGLWLTYPITPRQARDFVRRIPQIISGNRKRK